MLPISDSSLKFPQSIGFIQGMVKIVKQTMSKARQSEEDSHLALIGYTVMPKVLGSSVQQKQ